MHPAEIVFQNDSDSAVILKHTSLANKEPTCAYGGKPSYWKTAPPNAGTRIEAGASLSVGVLDSVTYWDSPSWIFLEYEGTSTAVLQVFVDMKGPGLDPEKAIWADIGPYDPESTEDTPMPKGKRMELIVYDLDRDPNSLVTVHIPVVESWTYLAPPPAPPPDNTGETIMSILNVALSTLITVCFVIPPAAEIGVALEAMTAAGKAAVAMTAAQGVLGVVTAPSHGAIPPAFGPKQFYAQSKLAQTEWTKNELRVQMEKTQAGFHHGGDQGGIETRLKSVATRVRKQLEASSTVNFDADLLEDTKQCLEFFALIICEDKPFQQKLLPCLDLEPSSGGPTDPPDKIKLALGFAGLSMTLEAFSNGYALRSFLRAASNQEELEKKLTDSQIKLTLFDADHVYDYFGQMHSLVEGFKLEKFALAQRLSVIKYDSSLELYAASRIGGFDEFQTFFAVDNGIQNALWGPGTVEKADALMMELGLEAVGEYKDGHPRKWRAKEHYGRRGARSDYAYKVCSTYSKYITENVVSDVKKSRDDMIADMRESLVPYIADMRTPLAPHKPNMQVKILHSPVEGSPAKLELGLVQYGYSYINVRGVESELYWHDATSLALEDSPPSGKKAPSGAMVTVPKDPNNLRAEQLAVKVKPVDDASREVAPLSPTSLTKPYKVLPTYVTAFRQVYRRFWTDVEQVKTGQLAIPSTIVKRLGNLDGEEFIDTWDTKLVLTGKV